MATSLPGRYRVGLRVSRPCLGAWRTRQLSGVNRYMRVVTGAVLAFLGLAVGAVAALVGFWVIGPDGMRSNQTELSTDGAAIATTPEAIRFSGELSVTAEAAESAPVFIGLAHDTHVRNFLADTAHMRITELDTSASITGEDVSGERSALATAPDRGWWEESVTGKGPQTLKFEVPDGPYDLVVMHTDGSPGLSVNASIGVGYPGIFQVSLIVLGVAALLLIGGVLLVVLGRRRRRDDLDDVPVWEGQATWGGGFWGTDGDNEVPARQPQPAGANGSIPARIGPAGAPAGAPVPHPGMPRPAVGMPGPAVGMPGPAGIPGPAGLPGAAEAFGPYGSPGQPAPPQSGQPGVGGPAVGWEQQGQQPPGQQSLGKQLPGQLADQQRPGTPSVEPPVPGMPGPPVGFDQPYQPEGADPRRGDAPAAGSDRQLHPSDWPESSGSQPGGLVEPAWPGQQGALAPPDPGWQEPAVEADRTPWARPPEHSVDQPGTHDRTSDTAGSRDWVAPTSGAPRAAEPPDLSAFPADVDQRGPSWFDRDPASAPTGGGAADGESPDRAFAGGELPVGEFPDSGASGELRASHSLGGTEAYARVSDASQPWQPNDWPGPDPSNDFRWDPNVDNAYASEPARGLSPDLAPDLPVGGPPDLESEPPRPTPPVAGGEQPYQGWPPAAPAAPSPAPQPPAAGQSLTDSPSYASRPDGPYQDEPARSGPPPASPAPIGFGEPSLPPLPPPLSSEIGFEPPAPPPPTQQPSTWQPGQPAAGAEPAPHGPYHQDPPSWKEPAAPNPRERDEPPAPATPEPSSTEGPKPSDTTFYTFAPPASAAGDASPPAWSEEALGQPGLPSPDPVAFSTPPPFLDDAGFGSESGQLPLAETELSEADLVGHFDERPPWLPPIQGPGMSGGERG